MKRINTKTATQLAELHQKITDLVVEANDTIGDYNAELNGVWDEGTSYQDGRSERWRESDAGSDYASWISDIEDAKLDELDEPDDLPSMEPNA